MRIRYATREAVSYEVDGVWLDGHGNLYEWAGDDWYLYASRSESSWRTPGGAKTDAFLFEGAAGEPLALDGASPFAAAFAIDSGQCLAALSMRFNAGSVRLHNHTSGDASLSLATLVPSTDGAQEWLLHPAEERHAGLFVAPVDAFGSLWSPVVLSRHPRGRPSALAECV